MPKRETRARRDRAWGQVEKIVGSLDKLPPFFRNGLYSLTRAELPDSEIQRAYSRCRAWLARSKDGMGECECGCGTKLPLEAVQANGQSIWCLDHNRQTRTFRGILVQACNREIAEGNRQRKWAHAQYVESCEWRMQADDIGYANSMFGEFLAPGAAPD